MLSQLTNWSKNRGRKNIIKKALTHELAIIKDTLEKSKDQTVPAQQTPFITETYDAVKVELASFLEPMALTTVQRTYEMIRRLNQPIASTPEGYTIIDQDSNRHYYYADFSLIITYIYQAIMELK
jgi:hypothetical protein